MHLCVYMYVLIFLSSSRASNYVCPHYIITICPSSATHSKFALYILSIHPVLYGVLYLRDRLLCNAVANHPPLSLSNTGLWASPWPPSQHGHKWLCNRRPRPIATPSYCAGRRPHPRFVARRSRISDMIRPLHYMCAALSHHQ